jgi:hypothetical protein
LGKQYKKLTDKDITFIEEQKLFYLASSSGKEVNLSPKGYDSIRVLDNITIVFMSYPGSGNRTYRDTQNNGEFTLVFNAFEGKPKILRLFCKAEVVAKESDVFQKYLALFSERESLVRDLFIFKIYAVESSCGESVPYMEYKGDRNSLKEWAVKMDKNDKLEAYKKIHHTPVNLQEVK